MNSTPARGALALVAPLALVTALTGLASCAPRPDARAAAGPTPSGDLLAGAAAAPAPATVSPEEAVAVFDSAWSRVYHTYYDTTFRGVDWVALGDDLRPAARDAGTADSLRAVVTAMLERLGDSHFVVIPAEVADALDPPAVRGVGGDEEPPAVDGADERGGGNWARSGAPTPGSVGVELRVVDGDLLVFRVRPDGPADRAGVRPGWALRAIDSAAVAGLLEALSRVPGERRLAEAQVAWAAEARLAGTVGEAVLARFDTGDGAVERRLYPAPVPGTAVRFGNLPTMVAELRYREVPLGGGCAGLIAFDVWMTPILPALEDAFLALRHCDGMILDLRGNPGGVAGMVMGVSGYFLDRQEPLGRLVTRDNELRLVSMPRRVTAAGVPIRPYDGPLALLVDGLSMSASEIFAAGLQEVGRARVFGQPTGGQALPALMVRLPNHDVLMHVFADLVTPAGVRIEGRGVIPDVRVPLDRQALLDHHDAALEAALHWIASRAGASGADRP